MPGLYVSKVPEGFMEFQLYGVPNDRFRMKMISKSNSYLISLLHISYASDLYSWTYIWKPSVRKRRMENKCQYAGDMRDLDIFVLRGFQVLI